VRPESARRLLEVDHVCEPVAEKCPLAKAARNGECGNGLARLEVRIEDDLDDRKDPAGFEDAQQFAKGGSTIRNFPEDSNEDRPIEVVPGKRAIANSSNDKVDVRVSGCLRPRSGSGDHALLDIERDNSTARANASRQRNRQASRPASRIQDSHAIGERERIDNERSTICLRERIVEFHQPPQPHRAWKTLATRRKSPRRRHDDDRDDNRENNDRGHCFPSAMTSSKLSINSGMASPRAATWFSATAILTPPSGQYAMHTPQKPQ